MRWRHAVMVRAVWFAAGVVALPLVIWWNPWLLLWVFEFFGG